MRTAAAALLAALPALGRALQLDADTPWVLVGGTDETGGALPPSLHLALRDLRRDWYGVFGIQPLVLGTYFPYTQYLPGKQGPKQELQPPYPVPDASTSGTLVFLGGRAILEQTLPAAAVKQVAAALGTAAESHGCFVLPPCAAHAYEALVCTGVDELGVVYSVYELSRLLGIDPQAFWTDHEPTPQPSITIAPPPPTPSGAPVRVGGGRSSPVVQYRGFFVNDEDMLSGFAEDPLGESVFSVEMWDHVFELILRLRGNAVIVGTAAFPDERSMELASR